MHNILVDSFSSDTSKEDIATQLKLVAQRDCGKLYQPIEFIDKVFDTIDDANAYLESHDKTYRNFAVKYYDTSDYCQSAETIKFLQSDNQDRKKAINKSKTNWLVKIEYHT